MTKKVPRLHPKQNIIFVTAITPGVPVVNACSGYRQRAEWPAHSKEHVMPNWWVPGIRGGGGALIGVPVGDGSGVSPPGGMARAADGAGIGRVMGSALPAAKASQS